MHVSEEDENKVIYIENYEFNPTADDAAAGY